MSPLIVNKISCRHFFVVLLIGVLMMALASLMACSEGNFDPNFKGAEDGAPPVAGEIENPCAEVTCKEGEVCEATTGECKVDLCAGVTCEEGKSCEAATGECKAPDMGAGGSESGGGEPVETPVDTGCQTEMLTRLGNVGCWRNGIVVSGAMAQFIFDPAANFTGGNYSHAIVPYDGSAATTETGTFSVVSCDQGNKTIVLSFVNTTGPTGIDLSVAMANALGTKVTITGSATEPDAVFAPEVPVLFSASSLCF
ncbi:MAG: hypothetical protein A3B79_07755 [Deltaproteobacteria bacterium RIFCSPHIGHO2_02_FULL_50_15]|nr:MAG: hypothetical protein A3B79_07755 [Deltaproteobacteria bacterium RIFCSPHIGHO2_02_FULL_50_15]